MNSAPEEVNQEHENARAHQERSHCSQQVEPAPVHFGNIGVNASRHSTKAQEVHGEEREIKPNEEQPEVPFSQSHIQHAAGHLRQPEVQAGKHRKHCAPNEHVMKMCYDEEGVVHLRIHWY